MHRCRFGCMFVLYIILSQLMDDEAGGKVEAKKGTANFGVVSALFRRCFAPFPALFPAPTTPHAPGNVLYLVPVLIGG